MTLYWSPRKKEIERKKRKRTASMWWILIINNQGRWGKGWCSQSLVLRKMLSPRSLLSKKILREFSGNIWTCSASLLSQPQMERLIRSISLVRKKSSMPCLFSLGANLEASYSLVMRPVLFFFYAYILICTET